MWPNSCNRLLYVCWLVCGDSLFGARCLQFLYCPSNSNRQTLSLLLMLCWVYPIWVTPTFADVCSHILLPWGAGSCNYLFGFAMRNKFFVVQSLDNSCFNLELSLVLPVYLLGVELISELLAWSAFFPFTLWCVDEMEPLRK